MNLVERAGECQAGALSESYFKHPMALVEAQSIGPGTRIWAFAL